MKKRALTLMCLLVLLSAKQLSAVVGFSHADYLRTLNRSASIGTADSMFFNPAGTVRMPDGLYIHVGADVGLSKRSIKFNAGSDVYTSALYLPPPSAEFGFMYKRAGSVFYMTILPTLRDGLQIKGVPKNTPTLGTSLTNYTENYFNYQVAFGAAFAFSDIFAMSFAGQLMSHNQLSKTVFDVLAGIENYSYNSIGIGGSIKAGALITPLPWMAISLNVDTGGPIITSFEGKSDYTGAGTRPSTELGLRVGDGFAVKPGASRAELGIGFNINDVAVIQMTGHVDFNLFYDTGSSMSFHKDRITYSFGGGIGFDFNFGEYVTWGFGAMYRNTTLKDQAYYEVIDSIKLLRMQSINIGTGFRFGLGSMVDLSLAAAYPLYFSTHDGFKFSKYPNAFNGYIESSDILISLGLTVKMTGLY
ncbi:MAG: hypothetical protein ACRCVN_00130 [Spirochaetia bacterium]